MKVNLGCGDYKLEGYVNVDCNPHTPADVIADLGRAPWPFETDSIDEARASHVIEHLTSDEFMHFFSELYRTVKNGAPIELVWPHPMHRCFFTDPTHKRAIMPDTIGMFSSHFHAHAPGRTRFDLYLGVDFDIELPLMAIPDERVRDLPPEVINDMAERELNVIVEYRLTIRPRKPHVV